MNAKKMKRSARDTAKGRNVYRQSNQPAKAGRRRRPKATQGAHLTTPEQRGGPTLARFEMPVHPKSIGGCAAQLVAFGMMPDAALIEARRRFN
jgi:hypothetical protein